MSRYIDADLCKAYATDYYPSVAYGVRKIIDEQPTADVQPVVRGEWIELYEDNYKCSACGAWWTLLEGTPQDNEMNFCPVCGARMVEDGEIH